MSNSEPCPGCHGGHYRPSQWCGNAELAAENVRLRAVIEEIVVVRDIKLPPETWCSLDDLIPGILQRAKQAQTEWMSKGNPNDQ